MNNSRKHYYPLLLYVVLLLLVWAFSFFRDIALLLNGSAQSAVSLITAEGVRWAVRAAQPSLQAVPWGAALLLVATAGLLQGSGFTKSVVALLHLRRLTRTQWRAFGFSTVAGVIYGVLLYMSATAPWNLLCGVTNEPALSPLLQGWPLLLFIGVLCVSLVYGFIGGNYRSAIDVASSMGNTFSIFVPAIMSLIPASGITPCLHYVVGDALSLQLLNIVALFLYALPFIYIVIMNILSNKD